MHSKGFVVGFNKIAGPIGLIGKAAKKVFSVNNLVTGAGAVMEGVSGMKKMTDAATRI